MKRKLFLFVLALTLLSTYLYSQPQGSIQPANPVQIIDLSVSPIIKPTLSSSLNDSVFIEVTFKINNKALASKAFYLFGTTADTADVLMIEVPFVNQGAHTLLQSSHSQKHVIGYDARVVLGLSKQQSDNFRFLTVSVQNPNGQISNKLYFQKL